MSTHYYVSCYVSKDDFEPEFYRKFTFQDRAEKFALKMAESKEWAEIIVSFYHSDDDQSGYINRGVGASFDMKNWVEK